MVNLRKCTVIFAASALGALSALLPAPLWASSAAAPPDGNSAWNRPDDPECKQNCTYDKANESLLLLLHYQEGKYGAIDLAMKDGDHATAKQSMGSHCVPGDSPKECWERYKRYHLIYIADIRAKIISNETAASKLLSKQVALKGGATTGGDVSVVGVVRKEDAPKREPLQAYFPKYDELVASREAELQKLQRQKASATEKFVEWLKTYPKEPDKADFVKTKKILRNPDNAADGTFTVIDTHPDGTAKVDDVAYAAAMKAYQNDIQALKDDQIAFQKAYGKGLVPKEPLQGLKKGQADELSRQVLINARGALVDSASGAIQDFAARPKTPAPAPAFAGKGPGTSRTPSATAQQSPTPSAGGSAALNLGTQRKGPLTQPKAMPTYTGNEEVQTPKGGKGGGPSVTLGLPAEAERQHIIRKMREDIADEDPKDVQDLPPMDPDM